MEYIFLTLIIGIFELVLHVSWISWFNFDIGIILNPVLRMKWHMNIYVICERDLSGDYVAEWFLHI